MCRDECAWTRRYRFTGVRVHAKPWTPALLEIKRVVEQASGERFNFCLMNLYVVWWCVSSLCVWAHRLVLCEAQVP